jgi:hypothetical protein
LPCSQADLWPRARRAAGDPNSPTLASSPSTLFCLAVALSGVVHCAGRGRILMAPTIHSLSISFRDFEDSFGEGRCLYSLYKYFSCNGYIRRVIAAEERKLERVERRRTGRSASAFRPAGPRLHCAVRRAPVPPPRNSQHMANCCADRNLKEPSTFHVCVYDVCVARCTCPTVFTTVRKFVQRHRVYT